MRTLRRQWNRFAAFIGAGVTMAVFFGALYVWGQSDPLGMTIAPLGNNHFSLTVTNGPSTNQYKIEWAQELNGASSWSVLKVGNPGETNWEADMSGWRMAFFRATILQYYGGIPDYELADPNNPGLGRLTIVIDNPLDGAVLQ